MKRGVKREPVVVGGWHAVLSVLEAGAGRVLNVWLEQGRRGARARQVEKLAREQGIALERIGRDKLDALAGRLNHQGVLARARERPEAGEEALWQLLGREPSPLLLVLDGVQDPHNLGACLRTADGAGVDAVLVPKDRAAGLTPVVRKVAAGAAETVPLIRVTNLARCLRRLKKAGVWLVGTVGEARQELYEVDLTGPLALILGGEGKGIRRLTREHCDGLAGLPMAGATVSLNVSVAAGVALYEAVRQRRPKAIAAQE